MHRRHKLEEDGQVDRQVLPTLRFHRVMSAANTTAFGAPVAVSENTPVMRRVILKDHLHTWGRVSAML